MVVAPPFAKAGVVGAYSWHNEHLAVDAPDWLLALVFDTTDKAERKPGTEANRPNQRRSQPPLARNSER